MGTKLVEPDAATLEKMLAGLPRGTGEVSARMNEAVIASSQRVRDGYVFLTAEEFVQRRRRT